MEQTVKKREWVKNAAIIFLVVMLVLTFFSNTFMNRSLPEVSTQYVQSGSINAKIRGSGTVAANQTYDVTVDQTKKVETVCVKVGQTVEVGDLLFVLEAGDSTELEQANDALYDAEIAYRKAVINASTGESYKTEKAAIASAESALKAAQSKAVAPTLGTLLTDIKNAQDAVNAAQSEFDTESGNYDDTSAKVYSDLEGLTGSVSGDEVYKPDEVIKYAKLYNEAAAKEKYFHDKGDTVSENVWKAAKDEYNGHLALLLTSGSDTSLLLSCYKQLQDAE